MTRLSLRTAIGVPALLAACGGGSDVPPPDQPPQVAAVSPVSEGELRRYTGLGPATIAGRAAIGTATCAGAVVRLVPAITAVREAYDSYNRGQRVAGNPMTDLRVTSVRRQGVCDADGRFRFANLPEGQWVVATEIRGSGGRPRQLLHRLVAVRSGQPVEVDLGERDVIPVPNARMAGS